MNLLNLYKMLGGDDRPMSEKEIDFLTGLTINGMPFGQPPPTNGHGDVWMDIILDLEAEHSLLSLDAPQHPRLATLSTLIAEIRSRRNFGIVKYGRPLRYNDGRNKQDLREELMDAIVYARRDGELTLSRRLISDLLRIPRPEPLRTPPSQSSSMQASGVIPDMSES